MRQAIILLIGFLAVSISGYSQNNLRVIVQDGVTLEKLPGASVIIQNASRGSNTDKNGVAEIKDLPPGNIELKITFIGYRDTLVTVVIPEQKDIQVSLMPAEEVLEGVIVTSTRTNSRIEDLPLKVEVLGLEEMNEESTLVPGNIASILGDLAVITIQRTSPVNGNDAIRMQGLDPQYMLVARDGLPLYGGFSGSLGVLSIPPLDLRQVEIIKGSVSTLYGGGAIAGMINIISKEPSAKPQRTLLFNISTLKERNVNTFFSGRINKKTSYTLFSGANIKSAADINKDGFSEVPDQQNYTLHPRFFFELSDQSHLKVGVTANIDNRRTGDIEAVRHEPTARHPYLENEKTFRNIIDLQYNHNFTENHTLSVKSAWSAFRRNLHIPGRHSTAFHFNGIQYSSYSEISDQSLHGKHNVIAGANLITESFRKLPSDTVQFGNYGYITAGLFLQDDWQVGEKFMIEMGLRIDHHNIHGYYTLPRIALFYKPVEKLSVRLASGAGYKSPDILSLADPSPTIVNNNASVQSEYSGGINADINYKTLLSDELELSINQAFYYAQIKNSLRVITDTINQVSYLENQDFTAKTMGTDTYVQAIYKHWEIYLGYNHTEAVQEYHSIKNPVPFNPQDKFSTTLAYESEGKWRTGVEASYSANQYIYPNLYYYNNPNDEVRKQVPDFWFLAAMIERKFSFGSIVINVENFLDTRQSKFEILADGPINNPSFKPVWAPLDGRVFNLSVKVDL